MAQQRVQQNNQHPFLIKLHPTVYHRMETFAETLPDKVKCRAGLSGS